MFRNKTLLNWEDPRFAEKFVAKHLRYRDYLAAFGKNAWKLALGTYVFFWVLRWISPRGTTSLFDLEMFGIVALIVVGYFLIWLMTLAGSKLSRPYIALREKDILYLSVEGSGNIPYEKLENFSLLKKNLEGDEFFVLLLKEWDGVEHFIEIDPQINNDALSEILESRNVQRKVPLLDAG